jgi:twitching motility protein PilT
MIDYANKHRKDHILTIEDPIEFVHESQGCLVTHREVGIHTKSFAAALRCALREDPDSILVGEMRDLETIRLAVEAAATGTSSSARCIPRTRRRRWTA